MKLSLDTSIIIEVERQRRETLALIENLLKEHEIFISAVVPSEIFTGTYLREDYKKATLKAKRLFANFEVVPLNEEIADSQINALLITDGAVIEYQDVAVAATFLHKNGDYLLTGNKKHFTRIPELRDKTLTPDEADDLLCV